MTKLVPAARRLRGFSRDRRGNVAMILALSLVPVTLGSLGAVDLTRGIAAKVQLQDALDAAALAAGRSNTSSTATLQQTGSRILAQNLSGASDFTLKSSSFTFGANNTVVAQATATYVPALGGLIGAQTMSIGASTEITRANNMLEIALVLDNTGSMSQSLGQGGSKISLLRTAASNFVDTMVSATAQSTSPNPVRIALVPFSNTVRVGSTYKTATWMDQAGVSPLNNEIFTKTGGTTTAVGNRWTMFAHLDAWRGCIETRKAPYDIQEAPPTTSDPASLYTPMFAPDENDSDNNATNDYLKDPKTGDWWSKQGDTNKYLTGSAKVTLGASYGPNQGCGMQSIQRLTTNFSALKTAINSMQATGDTNIPIGLMWGWHALSPNAPFADGTAYNTLKYKKIVVLMTDGQNTMTTPDPSPGSSDYNHSYYSANGYIWQGRVTQADGTPLKSLTSDDATRTAAMDDRLKKLCTNMKASNVGIEIYTVGVGVTSSSKALLQACATDTQHYFDVQSGTNLNSAFQSIANSIAQIHLSR